VLLGRTSKDEKSLSLALKRIIKTKRASEDKKHGTRGMYLNELYYELNHKRDMFG